MEVSKLTLTNQDYDEVPMALVKYIHEHPDVCRDTTRIRICKAVSIATGVSRSEVSKAFAKLLYRGVIKVAYNSSSRYPKAGWFYIDENYPGIKQMLCVEEEQPTVEEPTAEEEPKNEEEPQTIVAPVEAMVDGQTITVNVTINLRR